MERDGPLYAPALAELADDLLEEGVPLFKIVLMGLVVVHIQVVGPALDGHQFRLGGAEQHPGSDLFLWICLFSERLPYMRYR